ncbi:DUF4189 domain-containing protein [Acinetobacter sp. C32I]|uniref:DUF4189 domain-containing protein n=1 Tax=Acinetobacter sp. C32I TaxID=2950074 RepID=UPI0020367C52|nr:DUF4189 domain-containing protein [Acinetobacter sp. C32I]USA54809.1 DUF4189 domain-containing protein [Acinetobacter sp. C32I]
MNKFIKHLLCLGLLGLSGSAYAQAPHVCGAGPGPNEVLAGMQPGGNGIAPTPLCYWKQQSQQGGSQQPPQPTGYWVKTWGAIAPSPKGGVLGVVVGADSEEEAERLAMADCKQKGGQSCEVHLTYHNQCAVMILGQKFINTFSNATIKEASERGLKHCQRNDTNCEVYYSACTEPRFVKY